MHRQLMPSGELGIWALEEEESFFLERLDLFPEERAQISQMKGRRRLEWMAGRYLLHYMSGREIRGACLKDEYGKPHLENSPFQISISHSHKRIAVLAAPGAAGVDIQFFVEKIERIAYRFMREEESESLQPGSRLEHLHAYWGAKEALYKAYGRRQLDFLSNLCITPFEFSALGGQTTGWIQKDQFRQNFEIYYQLQGDYILVWALAISES